MNSNQSMQSLHSRSLNAFAFVLIFFDLLFSILRAKQSNTFAYVIFVLF